MKVLVCSETFKGTLEAPEAGKAILGALGSSQTNGRNIPLSDGGWGLLASMSAATDLKIRTMKIRHPYGKMFDSKYGIGTGPDGKKYGVVEMAQTCGLPQCDDIDKNPLECSSFGFGRLLQAACQENVEKIYLGIGGTCTNDGGIPALQAIGMVRCRIGNKWYTKDTEPLLGKHLTEIEEIVVDRSVGKNWPQIVIICDVHTPLLGKEGATAIYGPQKGATTEAIRKHLENGLANVATKVQPQTPETDLLSLKGGGAAGGAGAFLVAIAGAIMTAGAVSFAEIVGLRQHIQWADVIITGEGSFDIQTLDHGKTISHVRDLCLQEGKPLVIICGRCTAEGWDTVNDKPIVAIYTLTPTYPLKEAMTRTAGCLSDMIVAHWNDLERRVQRHRSTTTKLKTPGRNGVKNGIKSHL